MKKLMLMSLLILGAPTLALADEPRAAADGGKQAKDEQKIRSELEEARRRLDEAARQVAELSAQLGRNEGRGFVFIDREGGPRRAMLGVQIDPDSGKDGARVLKVSPGGAAEDAGLADGDVIVALDDVKVAGRDDPNRIVVDHMRSVKPDQKVKVKVVRAGKNKDFVVVARPMVFNERVFSVRPPEMGAVMGGFGSAIPHIRQFHTLFRGDFGGLELASLTPKLGAYFGASNGVLVVKAPDNDEVFKLEDGDVIQSIDGRKPEDGAHALRILRSYKSGEKLTLSVLRQRKPLSLAVTMPDRPEFEDHFAFPPEPAVPAIPAHPPAPTRAPPPPVGTPGSA